ncbi:MAG: MFS transporter [Gammaproteobacteria bacterium]|nr:MAG: MFS transporter [Gammaproteobacteria bacterium]
MYDFANSGYTTVVLTAVYNVYFVNVVAGNEGRGTATFLWTLAVGIANALVLLSAPVLGAIADHSAAKKRFLLVTTSGCVLFTALLATTGPGTVLWAMTCVVLATFMFASGENFIAAFLPEIASSHNMGRISAYGWSLGYMGGLLVLGLCLAYITWARGKGLPPEHYVPVTMLLVAGCFALAALPTFVFLRERAVPAPAPQSYLAAGFARVRETLAHARRYQDLFRFLVTLVLYQSGINAVVVLAAIYAQQEIGLSDAEVLWMILIVNITAALGALLFGHVQDRLGSVPTLAITLLIWMAALLWAFFLRAPWEIWGVANLIGLAMGASQSAGRALIGLFSPPGRSAEFFGLWGLAGKLASILGPMAYGIIGYLTEGDHRLALLSTLAFFAAGLLMLFTVDERRGRLAAGT